MLLSSKLDWVNEKFQGNLQAHSLEDPTVEEGVNVYREELWKSYLMSRLDWQSFLS